MTVVWSPASSEAMACLCCGDRTKALYFLFDGGPERLCTTCWCWSIAHGAWNSR